MNAMKWVGAMTLIMASATAFADDDARRDFEAVSSAKLSLTEAIAIAEEKGNGKAVEADVDSNRSGQAFYAIDVLSHDGQKLTEYTLDASTGEIIEQENEHVGKFIERVRLDDVRNAQTSLSAAIRAAERQTNGKVVDAEIAGFKNMRYELDVATADGKVQEIFIDATTGKVASK
jgi:uncharacterized membrane protein YkoI